ncbi:MAG: hypothetical protein JSV66_16040 [Trueperaceae bacterium]|nr:MAG: hypothetical protein JSV66_16040 [Trueperaceae bacterium]
MKSISIYPTQLEGRAPRFETLRPLELWKQDATDTDLWHHPAGLIVNTAALDQREDYFNIVRIHARVQHTKRFPKA